MKKRSGHRPAIQGAPVAELQGRRLGQRPLAVPLILASASPRRRRLMAFFPWKYRVRPSRVKEPAPRKHVAPRLFVKVLAGRKARDVARSVKEGLVLGADTIVYRNGKIYGKPSSQISAKRMLTELSGAWHTVYTGLSLVARPGNLEWGAVWKTRVKIRSFTPGQIDHWSRRNHDKAGAYAAQERGNPFVEEYIGDYDNVVGLPRRAVRLLIDKARRAGYRPAR
ncbi:MAG: septum formation protein Maf [Elusimicrobia bacterium]|nr:septum formation protein Maf [Elusimicrobiota bacterium]